jgi:hypothetical protein
MPYSIINQKDFYLSCLQCKHPQIAKTVRRMWSTADLDDYFLALLIDSEWGTRRAFDPETYKILLKLYTIHCFENDKIEEWSQIFLPKSENISR